MLVILIQIRGNTCKRTAKTKENHQVLFIIHLVQMEQVILL